MPIKDRRSLAILTLLMLAISLPFVRRAYFVDDYYFVTMAKGILQHPARPYDFLSDDAGIANIAWERGKQPRMVNPPLFHYFLAAVIALWGDATWKLRTASLIFPLISLYAMYFMGKRFVRDSLAAASLLAVTPAFWLTSYSLLIDSALLAFVLAALALFIDGQEKNSRALIVASGLLMGAALLTKYTGFLVLPLALAWQGLNRERCSWRLTGLALAVCAGIFALWGVWGVLTYGRPHFTATLSRGFHPTTLSGLLCMALFGGGLFLRWRWPRKTGLVVVAWGCLFFGLFLMGRALGSMGSLAAWMQAFYIDKVVGVASFLGGTSVFLFFAPVLVWARRPRALIAWGAAGIGLYLCFASRYGGFDRLQSATLAFFIGSTIAFLLYLGLEASPRKDRAQQYLIVWLAGGLLELVVVMPWTAGRYMLLILPPVCWLFRLAVERLNMPRLWRAAWASTAILGSALAYIDFAQAGVIVPLSQILESQRPLYAAIAPNPPHHWYYLADTFDGSQPYVLKQGWENVFPFQSFPKGSLFLRSVYRKSSWWKIPEPHRFQPVMVWEYPSRIPLRVMDVPASAGFYASCWGILPYAITLHPLERFELFLVK